MLKTYLKRNWAKYLFLGLFFFFATYLDCSSTNAGAQTFSSFLVNEINTDMAICYYFMIGVLIINADAGLHKLHEYPYKKFGYISIITNCIIVLLLFFVCSLFAYICNSGIDFFGQTDFTIDLSIKLSGPVALILSFLLIFLRCLTLSFLIAIINKVTKKMIGHLIVIFITIIDRGFYQAFDIALPLGILPIEHSKIFNVEAAAPLPDSIARTPLSVSLLYWIVPIIILGFCLIKIPDRSYKENSGLKEDEYSSKNKLSLYHRGIRDFSLLFKSGSTYFVIILIIGISIFTYLININYSMISNINKVGALNTFIYSAIYGNYPIGLIAPFLASMVSSISLRSDFNDGRYKQLVNQISLKGWFKYKIKYIACSTGILFIISYTILFIVSCIISPDPSVRTTYFRQVLFVETYDQSMLFYCFTIVIYFGVLSAVFSIFSAGISTLFKSNFAGIIMPGVLHYSLVYFTSILPISVQEITSYFIPIGLYETTSGMNPLMFFSQIIIILLFGSLLIWYSYTNLCKIKVINGYENRKNSESMYN